MSCAGRGSEPSQSCEDKMRASAQLVAVLGRETGLFADLRTALQTQREGMARHDAQAVERSIQQLSRTLLIVAELRCQRAELVEILAGEKDVPLRALEAKLPDTLVADIRDARDEAYRAAMAVVREVAINDRVVRRALEVGESFIQFLFSSVAELHPATAAPSLSARVASSIGAGPRNRGEGKDETGAGSA